MYILFTCAFVMLLSLIGLVSWLFVMLVNEIGACFEGRSGKMTGRSRWHDSVDEMLKCPWKDPSLTDLLLILFGKKKVRMGAVPGQNSIFLCDNGKKLLYKKDGGILEAIAYRLRDLQSDIDRRSAAIAELSFKIGLLEGEWKERDKGKAKRKK